MAVHDSADILLEVIAVFLTSVHVQANLRDTYCHTVSYCKVLEDNCALHCHSSAATD